MTERLSRKVRTARLRSFIVTRRWPLRTINSTVVRFRNLARRFLGENSRLNQAGAETQREIDLSPGGQIRIDPRVGHFQQFEGEGDVFFGFDLEADPFGAGEDVMRADPAHRNE